MLRTLFLDRRFFIALAVVAFLYVLAHEWAPARGVAGGALMLLAAALLADVLLLYRRRDALEAARTMEERLSNGDDNEVRIAITSRYPFPVSVEILDELPAQLQQRNLRFDVQIPSGGTAQLSYAVHPVKRGEYGFGVINALAATPLRLARRRYRLGSATTVPVYPSIIQMRRYELLAISNRLVEVGVKKVRRVGHTMEFDQIREYVVGDDYRTLNWRATARRATLMVNQYEDERSQPVYCIVDKGRSMKLPFAGMTLLDYAINAALVVSNIAVHKADRVGLITFGRTVDSFLPADRRRSQMRKILELLYRQSTDFRESDYEALYARIRTSITGRSLLLLFTSFDTLSGMRRRLPYFRSIARNHLLVVVFFENTELTNILAEPAQNVEDVYTRTIAEQLALEKRQIALELSMHGIISILSPPENLTVDTINKYLEIKARGMS